MSNVSAEAHQSVLTPHCVVSDGGEDPDTTPFLEIADQKGNPLTIPPREKKVDLLLMSPAQCCQHVITDCVCVVRLSFWPWVSMRKVDPS